MRQREFRWLIAILLLAVAVRGGCVWWKFEELSQDRDAYLRISELLIAGEGYSSGDPPQPTAFRPPLYVLLLAGVRLLDGSLLLGVIQIFLGAGTAWLTIGMGRRLKLGNWSYAAGLLCAVDPLLVRYTSQAMTEVTFTFLTALYLWALLGGMSRGVNYALDRDTLGTVNQWVLGALFGLCALCRPTIWAYGLLCAFVWLIWAGRVYGRRLLVQAPYWMMFSALLVVLPWGLRNLFILGHPVFTTTHGGYTLLLGNNPVFYRAVVAQPWGAVWASDDPETSQAEWLNRVKREMQADLGDQVRDEVARDRWMYERARANMRDAPEMFRRSCWLRFRRLWHVVPLSEEGGDLAGPVRMIVGGYNSLVLLLALGGLASLWLPSRDLPEGKSGSRMQWVWLCLLPLSFSAVHLLYWSNARMRAPLMPVVCLLACELLRRLMDAKRSGRRP